VKWLGHRICDKQVVSSTPGTDNSKNINCRPINIQISGHHVTALVMNGARCRLSLLERTGAVIHPHPQTGMTAREQLSHPLPEVWENKQEAASRELVTLAEAYTSEVEQDTRLAQVQAVQRHDLLSFADSGRSAGIRY